MMPLRDLAAFSWRRARLDTPWAFGARMARFGLLGLSSIGRERRATQLREKGSAIREIQGSRMYLNPKDPGISTDLLLDGIREPLITAEFSRLLCAGETVIDCGANIGYYALQEARRVGSTGKVHAIEPVLSNVQSLRDNVEINGYSNIRVHQMAVGNSNRRDWINVSEMSNMCSMVRKRGYRRYVDRIPVCVITLDSFVESFGVQPDWIRMDVEGYEVEVVQGMDRLLKSGKPLKIFMEVHFDILLGKAASMLQTLKEYGFRIRVATFEPHLAIRNTWLFPLCQLLEGVMGAASGYLDLTVDDLLTRREFRSGQVEDLEVIFDRS